MSKKVNIKHVGKEVGRLLNELAKKCDTRVAQIMNELPGKFERATLRFYPGAFGGVRHGVVHGRLKRSLKGFLERVKDKIVVGERSDVEYAAVHEYGFHGTVNIPAHTRKGAKGEISVRAHTREMHIREKRFFRDPMLAEAELMQKQLIKELGF